MPILRDFTDELPNIEIVLEPFCDFVYINVDSPDIVFDNVLVGCSAFFWNKRLNIRAYKRKPMLQISRNARESWTLLIGMKNMNEHCSMTMLLKLIKVTTINNNKNSKSNIAPRSIKPFPWHWLWEKLKICLLSSGCIFPNVLVFH